MKNLEKSREKLLKLILENPEACAQKLREFSQSEGGLRAIALCLDTLGYAYARILFSGILDSEWKELERLTRSLSKSASVEERIGNLHSIYLDFFSHCLGWTPEESTGKGSFEFIRVMENSDLEKLFSDVSPAEIALFSVIMAPYEMNRVIAVLPEAVSRQVILTIGRVQRLPQEVLRTQAIDFVERLKRKDDETRIARMKAREEISNAIRAIDRTRQSEVLELIRSEMPQLKRILEAQKYFDSDVKLDSVIGEEKQI